MSAQGDLELVRGLVGAALASLETSRGRIDDLNVYPVPDGDTGTNLTLTVRAVADGVAAAKPGDRPALAHAVARAALMGARGNSGVILSQMVRGVVDVLAESANGIDPALTARALRGASDAAYRAVGRPVEGTMLSVIRELAEEAERRAAEPEPLGDLLVELVRHGEEAVARTPEQLDVLREAGVVDAGGAGLVELLRGVAGAVTGEALPAAPAAEAPSGVDAIHLEPSRYRYCTVFVVEGEALDRDGLEAQLERLGDSLVVVGDKTAIKVHLHTDDPGSALSLGTAAGTIEGVEIANMHEQQERRERRLSLVPSTRGKSGVVAVVAGEGNRRLFETLAEPVGTIRVVAGGQTANPSTAELVAALEELEAEEAILLPNNPNVRLAAEHAAEQAQLPVAVVPTESIPAGLAALVAYDGTRGADENAGGDDCRRGSRRNGRGHPRLARRRAQRPRDPARRLARPRGRRAGGRRRRLRRGRVRGRRAAGRGAAHAPDPPHRRRAAAARRARRTTRVGSSGARGRGARRRPAALFPFARSGIGLDGCRQSGSCSWRTTRYFATLSSSCSG